jgi:hypothetical protein
MGHAEMGDMQGICHRIILVLFKIYLIQKEKSTGNHIENDVAVSL